MCLSEGDYEVNQAEIVKFVRERDYIIKQKLGNGACGSTVLMHDDVFGCDIVCKKFDPMEGTSRDDLYEGFAREIRLLYKILHPNVVRVFNAYLYPKRKVGYILMEYVQGVDVEDFLKDRPEMINQVFLQFVRGFAHLEDIGILHRDIRPANLLVDEQGNGKIIDFGFGKEVQHTEDFDKSVSVNLWCSPPSEFSNKIYDFTTEVYFLGNLFKMIIEDYTIENFKYNAIIERMCRMSHSDRISSFTEVAVSCSGAVTRQEDFTNDEIVAYRNFAEAITEAFSSIESSAKYQDDPNLMLKNLESFFGSVRLETHVTNNVALLRILVKGPFRYNPHKKIPVAVVSDFVALLRTLSFGRQRIVLANLHMRLEAIRRYDNRTDDDLPF